jgi:SAM-dependent methyltransferase
LHENTSVKREDWDRKHGEGGLLFGAEPNRFLVAEVAGLVPGRALDVACGSGRNAVWLASRGWRVTAFDFSDVALGKARALAAERGVEVDWAAADVLDWQPEAEAFDLVAVLYLQLPAEERRAALAAAAGAVAPGGTLLVVGHDLQNLNGGHGGPKDPHVLFTPEQVAAELPGLEIEKAERVLRPVETEDGEVQAIDALVRARRAPLDVESG